MMRWLLGLAGMAALAGCGSTSTPSTSSPSTTRSTATTTTTTTTAASSATTSPSSTGGNAARAQAASAACRSGQIAVTAGAGGAGLGHVGVVLRFRSTAASACTLSGYPGATLVTAAGHDQPARRTRNGYLGGLAGASNSVPVLRVAPGETVSALLEGLDSDMAHGGGPCPHYAHLLVTPPNQTVTARMISPLTAVCQPEVHPIVAGTTGRAS
jgi:uncharacterized protein DUF4232